MKVKRLILTAAAAWLLHSGMAAQDSTATALPQQWTLQQCIDRAKTQNVAVRRLRVSAQSAQIDVKDAKSARLPQVSFQTTQGFSNRPFQSNSAMVNGSQVVSTNHKNSYTGDYGLSASMPLYDGGQTANNVKLQQLNSQIADLNVSAQELNLEESVTKLYVQILYAQETVKQDKEQIELSQKQLDRGRGLFKSGLLNKADVAQLESQNATDRYQLVADESTLADYKLQLKQLLELDGDQDLELATSGTDADALTPLPAKADVYAAALALRPEIQAGKLAMNRSELDEKIAKAGSLPSISLNAGMSTNTITGNSGFFDQLKRQWSNTLGVTLSVPIYDRGKTKNAIAKARLEKESSYLDLLDSQKTLWKSIEGYWQQATSAQQRYAAAKEQVQYARTSYELTSEQFRLGLKNIVQLLTDKTNLSKAAQQMIQAKYMAVLNAAMLSYYQGGQMAL